MIAWLRLLTLAALAVGAIVTGSIAIPDAQASAPVSVIAQAETYAYHSADAVTTAATESRTDKRRTGSVLQAGSRLSTPVEALRLAAEEGGPSLLSRIATRLADERGSIGYGDLPRRARTFSDFDEAAAHLERFHGVDPRVASTRLHAIKARFGYGGADNLLIDRTGNVYDPLTRERLGSLTEGG